VVFVRRSNISVRRVRRQSCSSVSAHAIDIPICRYAGSIEIRRKWEFIYYRYYMQIFSFVNFIGQEYDFVKVYLALIQWVSNFGVPKDIRTDGGSQFTFKMTASPASLLRFQHLIVVAYYPQANGIVERRIKEVMIHLRALVYENRIREFWSQYLPLVQRILNYTIDGSIGTQPARVIFGDLEISDIALDVTVDWGDRTVEDYLVRPRECQSMILRAI